MKQQDAATATTTQEESATTHELSVKRDNGRWIVTDEDGNTSVTVRRKDKIRWIVEDEEALAVFQFPYVSLFKEACEKQQWKWPASQSKPLKLTVMVDAPLGEHTYSVFVVLPDGKDLQVRLEKGEIGYAEGGSPTRMIIMR